MSLRTIKQNTKASAYLSSVRSAITVGLFETYALNCSPVSKT